MTNRPSCWRQLWQVKIILPSLLTIALFVIAIFVVILPSVETNILDRKRESIRMLTEAAWAMLQHFHTLEKAGKLDQKQAQARAIESVRAMRYGSESKDYFWLNDYSPKMIMHPYRRDLEGRSLTTFVDPNGKRLFLAFVETVNAGGEGFVDYMWQWKDDAARIVPKLSFVKGFEPWKWIIGTGIYIEDVKVEIASLTKRLLVMSLAILALVAALSVVIISAGMRTERRRRQAEASLHAANVELEARVKRRTAELERANNQLAHLAITDGLVGCYNHRHLQLTLRVEIERSHRTKQPLSLLMIDVDFFKSYNDTHGHPEGDKVLRGITKVLQRERRTNDVVARYGGEEFAILLIDTNGEAALKVAEKIRQQVAEEPFENEQTQPNGLVTITIGVACCPTNAMTPKDLIAAADDALCLGKQNGRNRVEAARTTVPTAEQCHSRNASA